MASYKAPSRRIHRGFFYLDDETVINSLSAVESGKVDEVVAKVVQAKEGGIGGSVGIPHLSLDASKKGSSSLEEEMTRTRTRFSVFELWYQSLKSADAIGTLDGWDESVLAAINPGDVIQFNASLEMVPVQSLFRLYLWFAEQAKIANSPFAQRGEDLKGTKSSAAIIRAMLGDFEAAPADFACFAQPTGSAGPPIVMRLADRWAIEPVGEMSGSYVVVCQAEERLEAGQERPLLRLARNVPPTQLELKTLRDAVEPFVEPARTFGVNIDGVADVAVTGPALWIKPIAIYR